MPSAASNPLPTALLPVPGHASEWSFKQAICRGRAWSGSRWAHRIFFFPRVWKQEQVKIQRLLEVFFCIDCKHWLGNIRPASQNTGFADALGFLKFGAALELEDGAGDGSSHTVTPACKKPRLADEIAAGLIITPPPTLTERQSLSCFLLEMWVGVSNTTSWGFPNVSQNDLTVSEGISRSFL